MSAADAWASRSIGAKNGLIAEDAAAVEAAFLERMQVLQPEVYSQAPASAGSSSLGEAQDGTGETQELSQPARAPDGGPHPNKTAALRIPAEGGGPAPKPRRNRDKDHLRFISRQPCVVCGRQPCEAHHIRFAQPSALGRRVSDEFTVPLCRLHHRELHRIGNEGSWWEQLNIDPLPIAVRFWQQTKGVHTDADHKPMPERSADASPHRVDASGAPSGGDLLSGSAMNDNGASQ